MSTTAWQFNGTEGANAAVLRLKQLDGQDLIDVQDLTVIRWPHYATAPQAQEHVTSEGHAMELNARSGKAEADRPKVCAKPLRWQRCRYVPLNW